MIDVFRIDERLIHGQVATKWTKHYNITHIIVANDNAAENTMLQKALMMAAPSTSKVAIKTVSDAIALLKNPKSASAHILLLVNNPKDALTLAENIPEIKQLNVGNYGRNALDNGAEKRIMISKNVFANTAEIQEFNQIIDRGINVFFQTVPEDPAEDMGKLIKEAQSK